MSRPGTASRSLSAVSNPDLLKSPSNVSDSGGTKLSIMMEDDEFLRKWSGPMLLGPLLPAIFALMTIVSGHIILNTWTGYCGYSLDSFVGAALAVCYLFLIVYAWGFLGEKVYLNVPLTGTGFYILKPFSSLKWLMIFYFAVGFMSFIIWCVGAQLLQLSIFCANTSPLLYNFSLYLVVTYWLGFFIVGCYLIKLKFGNLIESYVSSQAKGPSVEDMEERIFRKEFKKYDKKKLGTISQDLLSEFLVKVAVFVPEEELPNVLNEIGVEGDEDIEFNQLLKWFKEYNVKMNGYAGDVGDDEEEEGESKKGGNDKKSSSGGGLFSRMKKPEMSKKPSLKESDSMGASAGAGGGGGGAANAGSEKGPEGDEDED